MKYLSFVFGIFILLSLGGCSATELRSPCPAFGKYCAKAPVNHHHKKHSGEII